VRWLVQPAPRLRPPVRTFLVFASLALAAFAAERVLHGALSAAGVEAFYLGPGRAEPLSAAALWEEVHVGAFVYGFVLFTVGALLAASPIPARVWRAVLALAVGATLADLFAPFAVVAAGGAGALRVATFVAAQAAIAALLVLGFVGSARTGRFARA
jgi:hypothetical protein